MAQAIGRQHLTADLHHQTQCSLCIWGGQNCVGTEFPVSASFHKHTAFTDLSQTLYNLSNWCRHSITHFNIKWGKCLSGIKARIIPALKLMAIWDLRSSGMFCNVSLLATTNVRCLTSQKSENLNCASNSTLQMENLLARNSQHVQPKCWQTYIKTTEDWVRDTDFGVRKPSNYFLGSICATVCACVCVCVCNTPGVLPSQYRQIWRSWHNLTLYHATDMSETNHMKWFILFTASTL
jgi:hypothetical protein